MTNEEAKNIITGVIEDFTYSCGYVELDLDKETLSAVIEALSMASAALDTIECIKIEVTEHHTFAKPDDVSDLDFPGVSSENK